MKARQVTFVEIAPDPELKAREAKVSKEGRRRIAAEHVSRRRRVPGGEIPWAEAEGGRCELTRRGGSRATPSASRPAREIWTRRYSRTAPMVRPRMKWRVTRLKSTSIGIEMTAEPAISSPQRRS